MPVNSQIYQFALHHLLGLPHCRWLGLSIDENTIPPVWKAPWRDDLTDNADQNRLHGGVIATLIDMAGGSAIAARLNNFENLATLDMRIDYLAQAEPQQDIYVEAECFQLEGQIAFVRSQCFQKHREKPFALGMSTFILTPLTSAEKQTLQHFLQQEQNNHV